jgi:hypothetical protein
MKKIFLLFTFLFIQTVSSQNLFDDEPVVRVRVMNSTATIKINFYDEWTLTSNEFQKTFSQENDEVIFAIINGNIHINDFSGETILSGKNLTLSGNEKNAALKIKDVPTV